MIRLRYREQATAPPAAAVATADAVEATAIRVQPRRNETSATAGATAGATARELTVITA